MPLTPQETLKPQPLSMEKLLRQDGDQHELWPGTKKHENLEMVVTHRRPSSANTRPSLLPRASSSYSVRRPAPLLEPSSGTSNQSRPPQLSARYSSHRPGRYTQAEVGYQSSGYSSSEDEEEAEYDEERQKAPRKLLSPPRKAPPPGTRRNHGLHRTQPQRRSSLNRVSVHNTTRLDHGNIPNDRIEPRDLMSSPSGFSSRMTRDRVPDVYFTQQRLGAPQSRHRSENGGVKPRRDSVSEQFLGAKYLKRNPEARKRLGVENELAFVREMLKTNRLKRSSQKAFHMRETELEAATVQMRSQNMLRMLQKRDIEPRNGRASRDLDPPSRHRQDSTSSISQGSGSVLHLPGGVKIHIDDRKQAYSVERTLARNQEGREISELRRVQRGDNKRLRASLDTTYPPSDSRSQRSRRTSSQYSQISVDVNGRRRGHMYHPQSNRWVREAMSDKDSREQWEDEWYSGGKKRPSRVNNIEDTEEENLSHLSQSQLSDLESPEERDVYDQRRHLRTRPGERVKKLDRQQAPSIRVSSVDSPPGRPRRPHSYHSSVPSTHDAPLGMSVYYRGASPPASLAHHGSPLTHPFHSNSSGYTHPAYPQANPFYSSGPGYEHMRFGSGYPPSQPFYPPSAPPPLYASSPPQKKATPAPAPSSALTHVSAASHDYNHVDNDAHGYTHSRGNGSDHWQHQRVKEQLTDVEEQHDKRILADKELATQLKALEGERTREEDEARIKAEEERLKQDWGSNSKAEKRKAAKAPRATPAEADERLVRLEKLLLGKQEEDSTIEETAEQRLREEKLPLAKQEYAAKIENAERRAKASAEQAAKKSMEDEYHAKSLEYLRAEKETVQKRQSRSEAHRSAEAAERRLLAEAEAKRAKSGKDKAITNTRTEALPARISGATKHSSDDPSAETPESSEGEDAPHLGNTGSFSDHPRNESNVESTQKHPTTFQCPKCPKRFTKAYMLRTHVRQHARISHELDEGQDGHTPGDIRGQYQAWSTVDVASPPTDAPAMLAPTAEAASSSVFPTGGLRGSANASPLVGVVEAVGEPSERPTAPVEDSRASLSRLTSLAPWQLEAFPDELPPDPVSRPSAPHPETPAHDEELLKEKELHVEKDTDDDEAEDDPDEPHGKLSAGTAAQFLMAASESEGSEDVEAPAKELGVLTMPTSSTGPWLPTGVEVVRGHVESSEEYDDDDGEDGITEDDDSKPPQIPQSTIAPWVSQRAPPVSVLPQALKESSEEDESDEEAADQEEGRKEINNPRIPSAVVQDYDESDDDDNLRQTFQNRRTLDLAPGHARRPVATASANPSLQQQMLSLPQRLELGTTTAKEYIPRPVSIAIADYEESEVDEDSDGEENDEDKEVNDLLREWTTVLD
ncbi:hypothetical protein K491DRAFT_360747 [Lophiostoma macrostomum CBS 122681]|uniref:C2H2-type domain-containing protein n=1 Tax=Lophiostoma macrostomum CBS 122681 TaxID=1314788 RepID=A0A6A6TD84_9PLEO|nr:hypothetical protein K491DRAFT_360747 [Lophiostoma macrostomum CBS 122681]